MVFIFLIVVIIPNQGNRNTNDGIALAQTIEGALDETTNMLQRIRVLAVQAANGTNTNEDRKALQQEVRQLSEEITRIADQTTFAGGLVLNGKYNANGNSKSLIPADGKMVFQVGANAGDTLSLNWADPFDMEGLAKMATVAAATNPADIKNKGLVNSQGKWFWSVTGADSATKTLTHIDSFIQVVDSKRAELGAIQNHSPALLNFYF